MPPQLTILHTEYSDGWGGQEMRIVSEASGIAARGHRVLIAARSGCAILAHAAAAGLETVRLPMPRNIDPFAIARLRGLIRRERVDIVNTHSSIDAWLGGIAAKLTAAKLIRTRHVSKRVRRHPLNFVHGLADVTVTTGAALRQQFIADVGAPPARVVSVPTGIDLERFAPSAESATLRRQLGLSPQARIVATIAVLRRAKRHVLLVEAAARLRHHVNLHFVFAGEGSQRQAIEQLVAERGLGERIHLLGHVDDVRPVLSGADVVASASAGMEGVPQALVQALAMARPVVATEDGAVGELIVDGTTGLLIPPEQPDTLAAAIEELLRDPDRARHLGQHGREHVAHHYSRPAMLDAIEAIYEGLMGS